MNNDDLLIPAKAEIENLKEQTIENSKRIKEMCDKLNDVLTENEKLKHDNELLQAALKDMLNYKDRADTLKGKLK